MKELFYIYEVVRGENTAHEEQDVQYLFFPPDFDVHDMFYRLRSVHDYTKCGYIVMTMRRVEREVYLNEKIDYRVNEYIEQDKYEQYIRQCWNDFSIAEKTAIDTIELVHEQKAVIVKQLGILIRRCQRADIEVDNEIALALYDEHLKKLRN